MHTRSTQTSWLIMITPLWIIPEPNTTGVSTGLSLTKRVRKRLHVILQAPHGTLDFRSLKTGTYPQWNRQGMQLRIDKQTSSSRRRSCASAGRRSLRRLLGECGGLKSRTFTLYSMVAVSPHFYCLKFLVRDPRTVGSICLKSDLSICLGTDPGIGEPGDKGFPPAHIMPYLVPVTVLIIPCQCALFDHF
jgi:hypothetical protein